ncbi:MULTISPECIES: Mu transposase C-terminal domain-containing protein [unclassified Paenibacillus]|uniref:Mu transposase C-terminal domain-containing protein n=1 Tax=unclassified Paenibacillus TaxID=185978 RepID=UPI00048F102A|nr:MULTISPECIES: Mu transposase C-terminal domain-containing protein [unclassified Paenibacillus]SFR27696.1 Mu transposase, C-terminal [Paenibacillus sp. cl130]
MFNILADTVLEWLDESDMTVSIGRVLWISPEATDREIVIMDITEEKNLSFPYWKKLSEIEEEFEGGCLRKIEFLPDPKLMDENFIRQYSSKRDMRWNTIQEIALLEPDIYIPKKRGPLIEQLCTDKKKNKKVIYELLKEFWFHGKAINGLLPDYKKSGARGKKRDYKKKPGTRPEEAKYDKRLTGLVITEDIKKVFRKYIKKYFNEKNLDFKSVWNEMLDNHFTSGYSREYGVKVPIPLPPEQRPTLRQFGYFLNKEYSFRQKKIGRKGKRKYQKDHRHMDGDERQRAWGPGTVYEVDSTPCDVYIVHSVNREQVIGTPILYIIADAFSSVITGFYGWLKSASYMGAAMGFENATTNKVDFCKEFGITISEEDWPSQGLPRILTADGGELSGYNAENMVALDTSVEILPSYRPELKGIIERFMSTMNREVRKYFPGGRVKQVRERGDKDYRVEAVATLESFFKFIIQCILEHNNSIVSEEFVVDPLMYQAGIELTPNQIWKWGVANRTSALHDKPRDLIRMNLLPRDTATVTQHGIKYGKLRYTCKQGSDEGWFEEGYLDDSKTVHISFDPRICGGIFVRRQNGEFIFCHLTRKYEKYKHFSFDEVKKILDMPVDQKKEYKEEQHQLQTKSRAIKKSIVAEEIAETNAMLPMGVSKSNRVKNMSASNQDERNNWAKEHSWLAEDIKGAYIDSSEESGVENSLVNSSQETDEDAMNEFLDFTQKKWGDMK